MEDNIDDILFNYKFVVIGASDTGKTNLINRYVNNEYDNHSYHTTGATFARKTVTLDNDETINCDIWDTAGSERYRSLLRIFIKNSHGIIIVYDISRKYTFDEIRYYLDLIDYARPNVIVALVGNKIDIEYDDDYYYHREVTTEEGQKFADENNFLFYETSGKDGTNVNELFNDLVDRIFLNDPDIQQIQINTVTINNTNTNTNKTRPPKRGCLK